MESRKLGNKTKIIKLMSNVGKIWVDYSNTDFIQYFKYLGIQMQHSIPYTPLKNGVAERKNISLKEMATCMMEAKTLPPKFLGRGYKIFILYIE